MSDPATPEAPAPDTSAGNDLLDEFVTSLTNDAPEAPQAPPVETPKEAPQAAPVETPKETTAETPPEAPEEDPLKLDDPVKPEEPEKPAEEEIPDAPKNRKDWDILRDSRNRYKQTAEEREQELQKIQAEAEELRVKAAKVAEMEEKLKYLDEYEKELAVTRLEATREYKETIMEPLEAIGSQAEILAKSNEVDPDKVYDIIKEPDPVKQRAAFKELTAGWDAVDTSELWNMTKDARTILDKQDAMREHAAAASKEQQAIASAREVQAKEAARKQFVDGTKEILKEIRQKTPFIPLREGETEEDFYTNLESKVTAVDFDTQSPRAKAFAAAAAIERKHLVEALKTLRDENATLRGRVKESNASKASVTPATEAAPQDEEVDFLKAMGVPVNGLNVIGM